MFNQYIKALKAKYDLSARYLEACVNCAWEAFYHEYGNTELDNINVMDEVFKNFKDILKADGYTL